MILLDVTVGENRLVEKKFRNQRMQFVKIKMTDDSFYESDINLFVDTSDLIIEALKKAVYAAEKG